MKLCIICGVNPVGRCRHKTCGPACSAENDRRVLLARLKRYRERHAERIKAKNKEWREAHPNYMREYRARLKAS